MFRDRRISAPLRGLIDDLTGDPAVRAALYAVVSALEDQEIKEAFALVAPADRAGMLHVAKVAADHMLEGRACDTCPATATCIRPLVVRPDECGPLERPGDEFSWLGMALACDDCAAIPAAEYRRISVENLARRQSEPEYDPTAHPRPVVLGRRVGGAAGLPRRASLRTCDHCSATIWTDQDEREALGGPEHPAAFLCAECGEAALAKGTSTEIPLELIL